MTFENSNGLTEDTVERGNNRRDKKILALRLGQIRELESRYGLHAPEDLARAMRLPAADILDLKRHLTRTREQ